jgi:hypothetical protein
METIGHERTRRITILKARGMKHANETKNLIITDKGLEIKNIPGVKESAK